MEVGANLHFNNPSKTWKAQILPAMKAVQYVRSINTHSNSNITLHIECVHVHSNEKQKYKDRNIFCLIERKYKEFSALNRVPKYKAFLCSNKTGEDRSSISQHSTL